MKKSFFLCIAVIFLFEFVIAATAQAASWRCGNLFVEEGVHSAQVQYNCGEPLTKEKSYVDAYGEVDKWVYGPEAGYFYVMYFYVGKLVRLEEVRQE
jgi:hypothetical protein